MQFGRLASKAAMLTYVFDWNPPVAEGLFRPAIEINPNYPHSHYYYALFLGHTGRFEEAVREITMARRLDPQSVNMAAMAWHAYFCARQYDKALQVAEDVVAADPAFAPGHFRLGLSFQKKGDYLRAIDDGSSRSRPAMIQKAWTGIVPLGNAHTRPRDRKAIGGNSFVTLCRRTTRRKFRHGGHLHAFG
jgi:tetratricopeptide (TPR) repeat protein